MRRAGMSHVAHFCSCYTSPTAGCRKAWKKAGPSSSSPAAIVEIGMGWAAPWAWGGSLCDPSWGTGDPDLCQPSSRLGWDEAGRAPGWAERRARRWTCLNLAPLPRLLEPTDRLQGHWAALPREPRAAVPGDLGLHSWGTRGCCPGGCGITVLGNLGHSPGLIGPLS